MGAMMLIVAMIAGKLLFQFVSFDRPERFPMIDSLSGRAGTLFLLFNFKVAS